MKGKLLKLACLAGAIFLLCMLPSCSLFDTISGVWDGRMSLEIDFETYGVDDSDVDFRITLSKTGSMLTGSIDEADDFGAPFLTYTYEWDIPGDINGTADGKNVTINFEAETSYVNVSYETVLITISGTITGTIDGTVMTGTVIGDFRFSGGYVDSFDFDGSCTLNKIS